jgi:hypothetical protein
VDNQLQGANPAPENTHDPLILEAGDVPGLQLCILKDQLPQSVFELDIGQLISWIQRFQSGSPHPYPFRITDILTHLEYYRCSCPTLRYLQLIVPWVGASPYIDIKINSKIGLSAKVQLTQILAADLIQYIYGSWAPAETSHSDVT